LESYILALLILCFKRLEIRGHDIFGNMVDRKTDLSAVVRLVRFAGQARLCVWVGCERLIQ
jgi:hypothetical protein